MSLALGRSLLPGAAAATVGLWIATAALLLVQVLVRSPIRPAVGVGARAALALLPAALEFALPVGLLAGAATAGVRLAERGELRALAAAGVPLRRLVPLLIGVGLAAGGLQAGLSHELAPRGRAAVRGLLQGSLVELRLRPGQPVVVGRDDLLVRVGDNAEDGAYDDLFVAFGDVVIAARTGSVEGTGLLRLTDGQARHLAPQAGWSLTFAEATMPLVPAPGRVELIERSSPRLHDLVSRMRSRGRDANYEQLTLFKRTTSAFAVPLLLLFGLAAGARSCAPGAVVVTTTVAWWVVVRLGDKLVGSLGPGGAAMLPVVLLGAAVGVVWLTWRDR